MKKILFICFLLFKTFPAFADFANSPKWLALVHYQKTMFGGYKATIGSDNFYLSKEGRTNPKAELEASIELFEGDDETTKCLFPARYIILKKEGFVYKEFPKCDEFEQFKKDLRPSGVTLLFTDAYMNNSSSLFGHTLFRADTAREGTQLLAHGINYGAFTKGYENSFLYAIYGLAGFYPGGLTTKPYYETVNMYNNIENRDIWEYSIDFDEDEMNLFVAHVWEIGQTSTPYYFLTQNCSYMLMEMMDAVRPSLKLASQFWMQTIPLDTIKAVNKRGIVKDIQHRPSRERKIKHRLKQMNKSQKKAFVLLMTDENADISFLAENEKADVLETAYQYTQYQYVAKDLELKDYRRKSFKFLRERNKSKIGQTFNDLKTGNDPQYSHASKQVGFDMGMANGSVFERIHFRPAYHSATDNPFGYLKGAAINFLDVSFRHYDKHDKYVFEKLGLLELNSFSPITRGFVAPSYRIKIDFLRQTNLKKKKAGYVSKNEVSGGGTFGLTDNLWLYVLSAADASYGGFLKHNGFIGVSGAAGLLYSGDYIGAQFELKKVLATDKEGSVFEQKGLVSLHVLRNTDLEFKFVRQTVSSKSLTEITLGIKQFF